MTFFLLERNLIQFEKRFFIAQASSLYLRVFQLNYVIPSKIQIVQKLHRIFDIIYVDAGLVNLIFQKVPVAYNSYLPKLPIQLIF